MKTFEFNGLTYNADDDFPTEFLKRAIVVKQERAAAAELALPALTRLAEVMRHKTGQSYKTRALLYSLWNGKPASLLEVVTLDWEIRKDLCQVILAFGHEDSSVRCFYDAIKAAVQEPGLWDWFLEEWENTKVLKEFLDQVNAAKERSA